MPTYEYICEKCGHEFELFQSMNDQPLSLCPKESCGAKRWGKGKVKRKISGGGGLIFKGSGFYSTDYRSENYKAGAKKETEVKSSATSTATDKPPAGTPAKTEGKPAKTETKAAKSTE